VTAVRGIVALALIAVFVALAVLHVSWAFGARWGADVAIPTVGGRPAFQPGRAGTLAVALLLVVAAGTIAARSWAVAGGESVAPLARVGVWTLCAVFGLRAVGNFGTFGFFKTVRDTTFARYDTLLFSPLCLALGVGCLLVALEPQSL
jgi:hypothetical protein